MDAIDFIESDIQRAHPKSEGLKFFFALGIAFIPAGLGLLLREDERGVFDPRILVPNTLAALAVFGVAWTLGVNGSLRRRTLGWAVAIAALALFFSTDRIFFPAGERTSYPVELTFWRESLKCLTKGSFATLLFSGCLGSFAFLCTSLPTRARRAMICATSGIAGAAMLGFHCDSTSVAHVLIAHIGQGILTGLVVFLIQQLAFNRLLERRLPGLGTRIGSISRLG